MENIVLISVSVVLAVVTVTGNPGIAARRLLQQLESRSAFSPESAVDAHSLDEQLQQGQALLLQLGVMGVSEDGRLYLYGSRLSRYRHRLFLWRLLLLLFVALVPAVFVLVM